MVTTSRPGLCGKIDRCECVGYKGQGLKGCMPQDSLVRHWAWKEDDIHLLPELCIILVFYKANTFSSYLLAKHIHSKEKPWDSVPPHSTRTGFYSSVHKGRGSVRSGPVFQPPSVGIDLGHFYSLRTGCRGQTSSPKGTVEGLTARGYGYFQA